MNPGGSYSLPLVENELLLFFAVITVLGPIGAFNHPPANAVSAAILISGSLMFCMSAIAQVGEIRAA
jgi:hypothetical protein